MASPLLPVFPTWASEGTKVEALPPLDLEENAGLKKNVEFWIRIYSQYSTDQGLIHDSKYIDHVYEVLNFKRPGGKTSYAVKKAKAKWRKLLYSVHKKQDHPEEMTGDEKKVFDLFKDVSEPNKFLNAAHRKRLRFQLGQKERFLEGMRQSGRYLPQMEEIFKREGMPIELTRLPFVESSFNTKALSKVGASGIWQFMRSTAQLFIQVDEAVDERNDPVRETVAAAKLLRLNFSSLKSWPLAVTAYNHGRKGMMRAVRRVASDDLEKVVAEYHHRSFGFASGNFFAELLAVIELEKNAKKYFKPIEQDKPYDFIEVSLPEKAKVKAFTHRFHLDLKEMRRMNPALTDAVYSGRLWIPANYPIRIPKNSELKAQTIIKYGTRDKD